MEISAFEIIQNNTPIYITYMTAEQLSDFKRIKVDIFKNENEEGYQREINDKRSEEFAKYVINAKGISPVSILINVRQKLNFIREKDNFGKLIIPDNSLMWIVDGQHRRKGLVMAVNEMSEYKSYQIPVVITNLSKTYDEAKQFIIINKTQKGVRSDLAERFLSKLFEEPEDIISQMPATVIRGITWIPKSIEVSEKLNERKDGVWYKRIRFPNEPKMITLVSQKSFTESLRPVIRNEIFEQYSVEEISELLTRYWNAIKELCPEAFKLPDEHLIQKTTGIFTLHRLFPLVISYCGDKVKIERIKEILSKMERGMNSNYWGVSGEIGLAGTSQKSFSIIYKKLSTYLEEGNENVAKKKRLFEL
ncbi:MAG: DGQHR domain-containing protein [Candidatus Nanoarchaeia archaeon]|nr:DGQHR domain-containing protein [Candidatus Nanoarchaeia archaeon]MDD5740997.1 DGQHR domain-containing protein [Candidatus Nanoarchaeia archaeon]